MCIVRRGRHTNGSPSAGVLSYGELSYLTTTAYLKICVCCQNVTRTLSILYIHSQSFQRVFDDKWPSFWNLQQLQPKSTYSEYILVLVLIQFHKFVAFSTILGTAKCTTFVSGWGSTLLPSPCCLLWQFTTLSFSWMRHYTFPKVQTVVSCQA